MGKRCKHTILSRRCRACRELQKEWYAKLAAEGFQDIEYGLENPKFTVHTPDPNQPGAPQSRDFYEIVWRVYHAWRANGRSFRDCRVAELLAMQQKDTGTVRGIARTLKSEGLSPYSTRMVQATLKEIHAAVTARQAQSSSSTESMPSVHAYHAAA